MLFDLRGRGRRRAVRIIYTGLALLIGLGLVGFGIGGGFGGGGLLNAASNNEGSSSASFASQIKHYQKLTRAQPSNVAAWEGLTKAILHEAGGSAYVSESGEVSSKGKELLRQAAQAWAGYIALNPPKIQLPTSISHGVTFATRLRSPSNARADRSSTDDDAESARDAWFMLISLTVRSAELRLVLQIAGVPLEHRPEVRH